MSARGSQWWVNRKRCALPSHSISLDIHAKHPNGLRIACTVFPRINHWIWHINRRCTYCSFSIWSGALRNSNIYIMCTCCQITHLWTMKLWAVKKHRAINFLPRHWFRLWCARISLPSSSQSNGLCISVGPNDFEIYFSILYAHKTELHKLGENCVRSITQKSNNAYRIAVRASLAMKTKTKKNIPPNLAMCKCMRTITELGEHKIRIFDSIRSSKI